MLSQLRIVWAYRYFWGSLVKLDLLTRYRKSVLGIGWSLLHPLAMTAVFCVVFSTIMNNGNWPLYAQTTLTAMAAWAFLRDTTLQGCFSLIRAEAYIRQVPLPHAIYPLRTTLTNLVHYLITLVVTIGVVAFLKTVPVPTPAVSPPATTATTPATLAPPPVAWTAPLVMAWALVPAVALSVLFVWGVATVLSFATVYFHDVSHIMELAAQVTFFLTPIIYPKTALGNLQWVADVNPVVPFIEMVRVPLVDGVLPGADVYGYAVALTVVAVGLAVGTLAWLQKKVIFHM